MPNKFKECDDCEREHCDRCPHEVIVEEDNDRSLDGWSKIILGDKKQKGVTKCLKAQKK